MNRFGLYLLLFVVLITMLFPLWYMVVGALSADPIAPPGTDDLIPTSPRWSNFAEAWGVAHFPRAVLNSILVALAVTAGNLVFALMAGYALARGKGRWPRFWAASILLEATG